MQRPNQLALALVFAAFAVFTLGACFDVGPDDAALSELQEASELRQAAESYLAAAKPIERWEPGGLRVAVISDLNSSYGSTEYLTTVHEAVETIVARRPDLVLVTGDMVAGQREGLDYRAMWQGFHAAVTIPLRDAGIPLFVTPGNHDASSHPRYVQEREIFTDEWLQYAPEGVRWVDRSNYPLNYAFEADGNLFISLDSTAVGPLLREQMEWLEGLLRERDAYEGVVLFGHVPLWSFALGREREIIGDFELEQLLVESDVTMFASGHHHAYFPGVRRGIYHVGMPCLGTGIRSLYAEGAPLSRRAWVEFVLRDGRVFDLDARLADQDDTITRDELPLKVGMPEATLFRDDATRLYRRTRWFPEELVGVRTPMDGAPFRLPDGIDGPRD